MGDAKLLQRLESEIRENGVQAVQFIENDQSRGRAARFTQGNDDYERTLFK